MQKKSSDKPSKRAGVKSDTPYKKKAKKNFAAPGTKKDHFSTDTNKGDKKPGGIPYKKKQRKQYTEAVAAANKEFYNKKFAANKKPVKVNKDEEIYTEEEPVTDEIRLNKYLSHAGIASRRKADKLIKEGKVKVNGTIITEMGYKVKKQDTVEFEGKILSPEKKYYVLLNKPKDFITTVKDERDRKTVMDLIRGAYAQMKTKVKPRLYPVGRLDRNTTGVLLMTNDGELAQKLTHPSSQVQKIYHVLLDKKLPKEDFDKIAEGGVVLEDGIAEVDEVAYPNPKNRAEVGVQIHTGKNRFVRRIFESLGYEIIKLDRVFFAGLTKKDLSRGRWRFLSEEEVRNLKHFIVVQ